MRSVRGESSSRRERIRRFRRSRSPRSILRKSTPPFLRNTRIRTVGVSTSRGSLGASRRNGGRYSVPRPRRRLDDACVSESDYQFIIPVVSRSIRPAGQDCGSLPTPARATRAIVVSVFMRHRATCLGRRFARRETKMKSGPLRSYARSERWVRVPLPVERPADAREAEVRPRARGYTSI